MHGCPQSGWRFHLIWWVDWDFQFQFTISRGNKCNNRRNQPSIYIEGEAFNLWTIGEETLLKTSLGNLLQTLRFGLLYYVLQIYYVIKFLKSLSAKITEKRNWKHPLKTLRTCSKFFVFDYILQRYFVIKFLKPLFCQFTKKKLKTFS